MGDGRRGADSGSPTSVAAAAGGLLIQADGQLQRGTRRLPVRRQIDVNDAGAVVGTARMATGAQHALEDVEVMLSSIQLHVG